MVYNLPICIFYLLHWINPHNAYKTLSNAIIPLYMQRNQLQCEYGILPKVTLKLRSLFHSIFKMTSKLSTLLRFYFLSMPKTFI